MALPGSGALSISMINGELVRTPTNQLSNLQALANLATAGSTPKVNAANPRISHWYSYVHDITPPGIVPAGGAGNITQTGARLSWGPATDNIAVTGYRVYILGGALVGTAGPGTGSGSSYDLTGLNPNTSYTYQVRAIDAAGNEGGSYQISFTTLSNAAYMSPLTLTAAQSGGGSSANTNGSVYNAPIGKQVSFTLRVNVGAIAGCSVYGELRINGVLVYTSPTLSAQYATAPFTYTWTSNTNASVTANLTGRFTGSGNSANVTLSVNTT